MKATIDLEAVRNGLNAARYFVDFASTKPYCSVWFEQQKTAQTAIRKAFDALDNPVVVEEME